jgi:hypothetical protein
VQFGARIVVSPQLIARRQWPVHHGADPIVRTRWIKRDRAIDVAESRYAGGRIVLVSGSALREKNCHRQCKSDQAYKLARVSSHNHILS